jgi:bifunctional non-homologous end joining protein LigD
MQQPRPLARDRVKPAGFIEPCQPVLWDMVPTGPGWLHELKYDGWRIVARKESERVRLWSRHGRDWTRAFRGIDQAVGALPFQSCVLDGEALAHDAAGWPRFHALRWSVYREAACLMVFDLLELDGEDMRAWPLISRRECLAGILAGGADELRFSEHMEAGVALYRHACRVGLEGIVSKWGYSRYVSGRFEGWRKIKCPGYGR